MNISDFSIYSHERKIVSRINKIWLPLILLLIFTGCDSSVERKEQKEIKLPNIIIITADDLGYGDIGCYGATDINTPNIDKIAQAGIKFTQSYSASSVCSPSRAGLLTGRYPQRMGLNSVFFPESFTGMPAEEITIAELLHNKNYTTGIIGKWHLGHHYQFLPLQQGFDSYFGIPYSNDMASVVYLRDNEVENFEVDQKYITKTYTEEALKFIDRNKDAPFFLYLAHNMPHVPIYASDDFMGTSERGLYGDVVQELDWSVGMIINKLEQLGILDNSLIIFSSDNGPWLVMEELGGSAGILREGKGFTFEGGMRVPTVIMWKDKILHGQICDNIITQMDFFPTLAAITGLDLPKNREIDGRNISELLLGGNVAVDSTFLFFDKEDLQCFRKGKWKVKKPFPGVEKTKWNQEVLPHDTLLFNLHIDIGERNNLHKQYPELSRQLLKEMEIQYHDLGFLPPSIIVRTNSDEGHFNYLLNKKNETGSVEE